MEGAVGVNLTLSENDGAMIIFFLLKFIIMHKYKYLRCGWLDKGRIKVDVVNQKITWTLRYQILVKTNVSSKKNLLSKLFYGDA